MTHDKHQLMRKACTLYSTQIIIIIIIVLKYMKCVYVVLVDFKKIQLDL